MQRIWEIDTWRGLAIIAMVFFHFLFDLNYFSGYALNLSSGILWGIGRFAGISFLLLVGVSLALSHSRSKELSQKATIKKYGLRGIRVFAWGLLITAATFLFVPEGTIIFGILHLIGLSIILSLPFLNKRVFNLGLGIVVFAAGNFLNAYSISSPLLVWLGIPHTGFYSFDYYPVLPWFAFVLFGLFVGNSIYPNGTRNFSIPDYSKNTAIRFLSWMGRHSLSIYLLHQLILIPIILFAF
jgi:uncharacterized membrane protein